MRIWTDPRGKHVPEIEALPNTSQESSHLAVRYQYLVAKKQPPELGYCSCAQDAASAHASVLCDHGDDSTDYYNINNYTDYHFHITVYSLPHNYEPTCSNPTASCVTG